MSVTVTPPLAAPTNIVATLQDGGNLDPNTTYYFRIAAGVDVGYGPQKTTRYGAPCAEQSFTTTTTKKSALITWDAVPDADEYNVYSTKVSGDYSTGGYIRHGTHTAPAASTNQYLMDAEANQRAVFDTFMLDYLPGGLDVEEGNVIVTFDGTTTLEDIADAVIAAGHPGCVHYDEQLFTLKGSLMAKATGSGSLTALKMTIITVQGWIFDNNNDSIIMTFGYYDASSDATRFGCTIGALVWSIRPAPSQRMKFYGCRFLMVGGGYYWIQASVIYFVPNSTHAKDCVLDYVQIRAIGSDLPSGLTTNFVTSAYFTGEAVDFIHSDSYMSFWSYEGQEFRGGYSNCAATGKHLSINYNKPTSPVEFYDRDFTVAGVQTENNLPICYYASGCYRPIRVNHLFSLLTTPGARVVLKDKDGNGLLDEVVGEDGATTPIDVLCWDGDHSEAAASTNMTWVTKGPFDLTITKDGYQPYYDGNLEITGEVIFPIMLQEEEVVYIPEPVDELVGGIESQALEGVIASEALEGEISD